MESNEAVADGQGLKRKSIAGGEGGKRKRKKKVQGVLEFIDNAAAVDEKDSIDEIMEDEYSSDFEANNEVDEFDKMLEETYKASYSHVTIAEEDGFQAEPSIQESTEEDPTIWKVKCMVGHERHLAFCLMQKYVDLKSLGTELHIISVFTLQHTRGFIFIEAYKQCHINEACEGLCNIYCRKVSPVPNDELSRLLYVRSKCSEISAGMWVRVKLGKYKGDLAQVVALNKSRKKATVKLVPRIDLQALAEKIGRGVSSKKTFIPRPRLISSRELGEFRPLIKHKRDRDVGQVFEVLDGMMLKDGYLFKKVPVNSLIFWGLTPSENELLRFEQSGGEESKDLEWLSLLYGEKNSTLIDNEGVQGGEGSSSSSVVNSLQVHDLVFFGQKHFGVIIEVQEEDHFKILKEDCEGAVIVSFKQDELKKAFFNKKLTALDHHMNVVCFNDTLRVLEGPLKDRQGVVKQIYQGTIFLQDENEKENNGYFCCKAQTCEKIKNSVDAFDTKGVESQAKIISSPKSSLLAKKRSDNNPKDGMFSIGQSLRIHVGPLKGYLCRVMAIQDSNVTVKLDSQHKILTVKSENLSIPREKDSAISKRSDVQRSLKSFNLLGSTKDRVDGVAISMDNKRWRNTTGLSNKRISCPAFPASTLSLKLESSLANRLNQQDHVVKKGNNVIVNPPRWRGTIKGGKKPVGSWSKEQLNGGGRSSWSKQAGFQRKKEAKFGIGQNNISERQNSFGRGQGFDGWNKRMMVNKGNNVDEQSFGKRPETLKSGRGGRGGRGGGIFGVRRSFGVGEPSSTLTNGGQQNYGTSEGNCTRNVINWNSERVAIGRGKGGNYKSAGIEAGGAMGSQFRDWNKPPVAPGTERRPAWKRQGGGFNGESCNRSKSFGSRNGKCNSNMDQQQKVETSLKSSEWGCGARGRGGVGGGRARGRFGRGGRANLGRGGFSPMHNVHNLL